MSLKLIEEANAIVIQKGTEAITISRSNGLISPTEPITQASAVQVSIVGILGIVELSYSRYLVVARTGRLAGMLASSPVFRVKTTTLMPLGPVDTRDSQYVSLLEQHLSNATLFYSPAYDLTSNTQRTASHRSKGLPTVDNRFFWNFEISKPLFQFPSFVFPVIYGVFSVSQSTIGPNNIEFALITRRSRFRAGTRYFRRGLDDSGNAANFNETEQVLVVGDNLFSFLQTRGSVPAIWSEVNNLKYKPKLQIGDLETSVAAAKKHFKEQEQQYGTQYLVNLVNQSGYEKPVKQVYEDVVSRLDDKQINYIYFDFHHECSKMRWHRVQLLVDELVNQGLDQAGWYQAKSNNTVSHQTGIVRTNCMDCLDRTNVVQSTLALYTLQRQLISAGVVHNADQVVKDKDFMRKFRKIWADNADGVSCAYSGTGALKTDFTRTGKRTKLGALRDLQNSVVRYYRNNLRDGPRQDGFSLFLGEYTPSAYAYPFQDRRPLWVQSIPYICGCCALIATLSILYPSENHSKMFNAIVTSVFALVSGAALKFMFANGLQYVNWPSLSPVNFVAWSRTKGFYIKSINSKQE